MQKLVGVWTAICICLLQVNTATAGPDANTNYFMEEKVSLFSFGMFRLEQDLKGLTDNTDFPSGFNSISASYDWDSDEINIAITSFYAIETATDAREKCKLAINKVRTSCGINMETGKPYEFLGGESFCAGNFSRIGFQKATDPEKLLEMDKKIRIQCNVFGTAEMTLSGKLLSTKVVEQID